MLTMRDDPADPFTVDGLTSTGALEAISALKLAIPGDLSLICFDDLDWMQFIRKA